MAETYQSAHKWRMRLVYVLVCLAVLYLQLLPFQTQPRGWAGPDPIVLLTLVWAARRPEYVPALLVALMVLLADFLLLRPPGVLAALMVVARQVLKRQEPGLRDSTFATEWVTAAVVLAALLLGERLFLAMFLVDQPPLGLSIMQLSMNVLAYPFVVLASHVLFGIRRIAPGDTDAISGAA